jgi:hypothetical protein
VIDHDRLFKELLSTFFVEFIELFLPEVMTYLEPDSVVFLDKEVFTDVTAGERYETDLIAQVQFRGKPSFFLIHLESQAQAQNNFGQRMFRYFARLHEKYDQPIYPIVLFSYDQPRRPAPSQFRVEFPDLSVLAFHYRVIQLNQLKWRDFLDRSNPVASALMVKMQIAPGDRAKVKAECLRLLVTLRLDRARMQLISGFIDTYLRLDEQEQQQFAVEIGRIEPSEQEGIMEIVTSWMEQGIRQGQAEGSQQEALNYTLRLLRRKFGEIESVLEAQVQTLSVVQLEELGEAVLEFSTIDDFTGWLEGVVGNRE